MRIEWNDDDWYGEVPAPYSTAAALLAPGIKRELFRYGSMRDVEVFSSPFINSLVVKYTLITGESRRVEIPAQLWLDEDYIEIMRRLTEHLGRLP